MARQEVPTRECGLCTSLKLPSPLFHWRRQHLLVFHQLTSGALASFLLVGIGFPRVCSRDFFGGFSPYRVPIGIRCSTCWPLAFPLSVRLLSTFCPLAVHFRRETLVSVRGGGALSKKIRFSSVSGLYTIISVYYMYRFFASLISCFSILCNFGIGFCTYVSLTSYLASVCGMGSVGWLLVSC